MILIVTGRLPLLHSYNSFLQGGILSSKHCLMPLMNIPGCRCELFRTGKWATNPGCTLLGDAEHMMPPFGGMGINLGLLDALTLTDNLTEGNFSNIQAAIAGYEQKMFAYAIPLIDETCRADDRIHTSDSTAAERLERMAAIKQLLIPVSCFNQIINKGVAFQRLLIPVKH